MKLSTNLIGLDGLLCTYWGQGKSEYTLHEECIKEDFKEGYTDINEDYYFSHFDNKKYMEDWNKAIQAGLEELILDTIRWSVEGDFTYTAEGYSSPKFYNYTHDVNYFTLEGEWYRILDYCRNNEDFPKFLKDHYTSCDGFTSFTANNLTEWEADVAAEEETAYGAALRFLLLKEEQGDLAYKVSEWFSDMFYSAYVNYEALESFQEEMKNGEVILTEEWQKALFERDVVSGVEKVAQDEYMSLKTAVEVAEEHYGEENKELIAKVIERVWEEIENNTLELDL